MTTNREGVPGLEEQIAFMEDRGPWRSNPKMHKALIASLKSLLSAQTAQGISEEGDVDRAVAAFRADLSDRRIYHALMTADLKNAMRAALSTACSPELVAMQKAAVEYGVAFEAERQVHASEEFDEAASDKAADGVEDAIEVLEKAAVAYKRSLPRLEEGEG